MNLTYLSKLEMITGKIGVRLLNAITETKKQYIILISETIESIETLIDIKDINGDLKVMKETINNYLSENDKIDHEKAYNIWDKLDEFNKTNIGNIEKEKDNQITELSDDYKSRLDNLIKECELSYLIINYDGNEKELANNRNITNDRIFTKLLTGYINKNGDFIEYSTLITLSNNPIAKRSLSIDLEDIYYLAINIDDNEPYLFDYEKECYIKVDERILQEFLNRKEGIRLNTTDTGSLLKEIVKRIKNNYNYVEFNNLLLNIMTGKYELKKELNKPKRFITPKKIEYDILENPNHNFKPKDSIFYKTLEQILGTSENLKDWKQRIGSKIFNNGKDITIYTTEWANAGKSILNYIDKTIFGILAVNTEPNQLGDKFNHIIFNNRHSVLFDETQGESFKGTEDSLKKITGATAPEEKRGMQTENIRETRLKSHVTITTNTLPEFNLNDIALLERISIIKLPNRFSYNFHEIDNITVFPINDNLMEELEEDREGLEHLIQECIGEYRLMKEKGESFINKKGVEAVKMHYLGNDHLMNFINLYTERTDYETENTTATEIYNNFEQYIKDHDIDLILDSDKMTMEIGRKLNKFYGKDNIIRKTEDNTRYLKNIRCNYTTGTEKGYKVNPELLDYNIIDEYNNKIFNLINKGYSTFELLKQQDKYHTKILEAINYLKKYGYILEDRILKTNEK